VMGALESLLSADTSLRHLPDKFGFLVDDGGSLPLASVDADVRFEASTTPNGPRFLIRLAGAADCCLGDCAPDHVAVRALRLARAFLALCGGSEDAPRRMKQLVARVGVDVVACTAGLWVAHHRPASLTNLDLSAVVGAHALGATHYVGAAAAFGRLHADQLERLASSATQAGAATLRLTPWRTILVVGLTHPAAVELAANLQHVGFIVRPEEPRLAVAACPGAPACGSATTKVQEDALTIASLLPDRLRRGISVHVSGCAKGCAHPGAVHTTLVGNAGQYDLVANGTARDRPVCTGLSVSDLPRVLAEHMSADPEFQH
jgi:precorrin-3B synthase